MLAGGGLDQLPQSAQMAIVIGALVGTAIPLLHLFLPKLGPWLPSAMGLGLAWIMPYANAQSFAIGGVIVWLWVKLHEPTGRPYSIPAAAGLIAGDGDVETYFDASFAPGE